MPSHREEEMGVFSICSPVRRNPIGMSVLEVLKGEDAVGCVKRLDMLEGIPVLDIKPYIKPYIEDRSQGSVGISGGRARGG